MISAANTALTQVFEEFNHFPIDRKSISQDKLDLVSRTRTSSSRWRGQFSPQLVDLFVGQHRKDGAWALDPFVGSGTVLSESSRNNMNCAGFDINPAAVFLARTSEIISLSQPARRSVFTKGMTLLRRFLGSQRTPDLFSDLESIEDPSASLPESLRALFSEVSGDRSLQTVLANSIIRAMEPNGGLPKVDTVFDSFTAFENMVTQIPCFTAEVYANQGDARSLPLEDNSIQLVMTSPPYINVFNYHQNYRPIVELLGYDLLRVAKTEIGANRKHRGNRFLTVVQYCLDMELVLRELRRVLKPSGIAIVVIGRESNVLGQPFEHGKILYALAANSGLKLENRYERVFTSRFGARVYEEILMLAPTQSKPYDGGVRARAIGASLLGSAVGLASTKREIHGLIESAIAGAENVQPSPGYHNPEKPGQNSGTRPIVNPLSLDDNP